MSTFESKDIRNLILLGHSGCGKTLLANPTAAARSALIFSAE